MKRLLIFFVVFLGIHIWAFDGYKLLSNLFNPYEQHDLKSMDFTILIKGNDSNTMMLEKFAPKIKVHFEKPGYFKMDYEFNDSVPPQLRLLIRQTIDNMMKTQSGFVNFREKLKVFQKDYEIVETNKKNGFYILTLVNKKNKSHKITLYINNKLMVVKSIIKNPKHSMVVEIKYRKIGNYLVFDKFIISGKNNNFSLKYIDYIINGKKSDKVKGFLFIDP